MGLRWSYLRRTLASGSRWLNGVASWVGLVLLALAVFAGIYIPVVLNLPAWVSVLATSVVLLAVFFEGGFRTWLEDVGQSGGVSLHQPLIPRHDQSPHYQQRRDDATTVVQHRVGILNPDEDAASLVRIHLEAVEPPPRHVLNNMVPVTPSAVPLLTGGDAAIGITLPPGREELWVVGYTATGTDGTLRAGGFAVDDQRWRGLPWELDRDERLRFVYRVDCDGRAPVKFSLVLYADDGVLRLVLQD